MGRSGQNRLKISIFLHSKLRAGSHSWRLPALPSSQLNRILRFGDGAERNQVISPDSRILARSRREVDFLIRFSRSMRADLDCHFLI